MNKNLKVSLLLISFVFGFMSLIFFFERDFNTVFFIFFSMYFIFYIISGIKLLEILALFLFFPYFPLIKVFSILQKEKKYVEYKIEKPIYSISKSIKTDVVDTTPLSVLSKYGDTTQKKSSVRLLVELIKSEKINVSESLNVLKTLQEDDHPDVVMYASDAMTELENFFIRKIESLKKKLDSPNNIISYTNYIKYYLLSGMVGGNIKKRMLLNAKKLLKNKINLFPTRVDLIEQYVFFVELSGENSLLIIEDFYNNFPVQNLLELLIITSIKYRNYSVLKKFANIFIKNDYKTENEVIQYLFESGGIL
ncbi:hypothetical protein OSSY52_20250 [Tepiditoga spiralis]|uniref:Uncharacterized protein n=1 Tax=Tepiditoga spiralis TaxID=2108365 RepID=A0A7G1G9I2_9BACT|nr:hypothetical protein [Tepiditoga spiralis]BBE31884.1 hypothetical protein OSSY52_20250 [Tepiditoga spiralis]